MKRVLLGALACSLSTTLQMSAVAQSPGDADVWICIIDTDNCVLLDTDTGAAWLTGACLKPIADARQVGSTWVSETSELVSVGRMETLLQQTFRLDLTASSPSISVENEARGGTQTFHDVRVTPCTGGSCQRLGTSPAC